MGGEKVTFLIRDIFSVPWSRYTRDTLVYLSSFYNLQRGMIYEKII